jgi:hypothetical protein
MHGFLPAGAQVSLEQIDAHVNQHKVDCHHEFTRGPVQAALCAKLIAVALRPSYIRCEGFTTASCARSLLSRGPQPAMARARVRSSEKMNSAYA